jgi:stringent starvation protein B
MMRLLSQRFGGVAKDIYVPIQAVLGIYAEKMVKGYSLTKANDA